MSEYTRGTAPAAIARDPTPVAPTAAPAAPRRLAPRNWSFRFTLSLFALVLALAPSLGAVLLLAHQADSLSQTAQVRATESRTRIAGALLDRTLAGDAGLVRGIAQSDPALQLVTHPSAAQDQQIQQYRLAPILAAALGADPALQNGTLYVTTSGGTVLAATRAALLSSTAGSTLAVQEAIASRAPAAVIGPSLGSVQSQLVMAVPIMRGATAVGAAVGQFDPEQILGVLQTAGAAIVLADGRSLRFDQVPGGAPLQLLGAAPGAASAGPTQALVNQVQTAATSAALTPLSDGSRAVAVGPNALVVPPVATATSVLDDAIVRGMLTAIALLAVALSIAGCLRLTAPLARLATALVAVRGGNYATRVRIDRGDEVGQIAATVDMLIARAQALVADLDNQRLELENGIIQLFTELAEAASGDLTVRPTMSEGSLGAVADSVGILLERFNETVKRIQATAGAVSSGTSQMASTILRVSQEAQKQASQLTSGALAISEMAASAQSVSQRTQAATDVASQAVAAVESGHKAVHYAREAVKRTGETSKKAARQVKSLGESAQLMGNALILVQRNTEELHLIAGNASIEAARYAENGGVFRTVADSIEQLAQQSQVALRQIQSVVENTQRETSRVVAAIEDVSGEVMHVSRAVSLAGENFDTINMVVQRLADLNTFIASASEQQAHMAVDVAEVITALNQVSVQTSMNTAASAEAAVRLRQLTEQLNDSVSTLKVS